MAILRVPLASTAIFFTALAFVPFAPDANAAIRCNGAYQIIKGHGQLATPYCGDSYLAHVARTSYGWTVSNRAVRQNPSLKERICLHVGHDIRVSSVCAGLRQEDFGGDGR